ncbi:unnamed protein product [Prorocentrum cordatum]|uniref:Uncharacterized protein n=1 Tax=Prorocentrum cordatum TaxID=2364126 RepID=A0ABN9VP42_9DINO|nr:unnamed protein product [Polarella glacialis]
MVQHIPQERDDLLWAVVAVLLVVLFATSSSDECATQGFQEAVGPGPTVSFVAGDTANLAALFSMGVLFQCSARYLLSSKVLPSPPLPPLLPPPPFPRASLARRAPPLLCPARGGEGGEG